MSCENGAVTVGRGTAAENGVVRIPFAELELGEKYYIEFEYSSKLNADTSEVTNVTANLGGYSSLDRYYFRYAGLGFWRPGTSKKVTYKTGKNSDWHRIGTELDLTNTTFTTENILKHYFDGKPLFSGSSFSSGYAYDKVNKNQIIFAFDANSFAADESFSFRNFGVWKYEVPFEVTKPVITVSGEKAEASVTVTSTDKNRTFILVLAQYDANGCLAGVTYKEKSGNNLRNESIVTDSIDIGADVTALQAILWDGFENLTPYVGNEVKVKQNGEWKASN